MGTNILMETGEIAGLVQGYHFHLLAMKLT